MEFFFFFRDENVSNDYRIFNGFAVLLLCVGIIIENFLHLTNVLSKKLIENLKAKIFFPKRIFSNGCSKLGIVDESI